jgi:hypothetical protein
MQTFGNQAGQAIARLRQGMRYGVAQLLFAQS